MNDPESEMNTIITTSLDPQIRQLMREAGKGKLRLTIVEEDGQCIAEVGPVRKSGPADLWEDYNPRAARDAWRASAGVLKGVDVEALLADLKAEREQDSPGRPTN